MPWPVKVPPRGLDDLLARIHTAFPELAWTDAELVTEGWDHEVVILDRRIVFRFPNDELYRAGLATEVAVLDRLATHASLAIPRYSYLPSDGSFAGYPLVPGDPLSPEGLAALAGGQRSAIAEQLGRFLGTLHTLESKGHRFDDVDGSHITSEQEAIRETMERHLPAVLSPADLAVARTIMDNVGALIATPRPTTLIHGDVYASHLLWDGPAGQLGLIDFSDMAHDDPAIDLAELHELGTDFVDDVYEAYTGPKDPTFLERAWTYQRWVAVFLMTDHFAYGKTTFAVARETFDDVKHHPARPDPGWQP